MSWPAADDETAFIFVDHRDEEDGIARAVSEHLAPEDALEVEMTDAGELWVTHRGRREQIPLTFTPHDRYVAISSLAALLASRYRFYVEVRSRDSDTHALLVMPEAAAAAAGLPPAHLQPLVLGRDYFSAGPGKPDGIEIPYLGHDCPEFAAESAAVASGREVASTMSGVMIEAMLGGKIDDAALRDAVTKMSTHPELREQMKGQSVDDIVAEMKAVLGQATAAPEVAEARAELESSLGQLRKLTGAGALPPPKPWWKFW